MVKNYLQNKRLRKSDKIIVKFIKEKDKIFKIKKTMNKLINSLHYQLMLQMRLLNNLLMLYNKKG